VIPINIEVPLQGTFLLLYNSQGVTLGYDEFALQAIIKFAETYFL